MKVSVVVAVLVAALWALPSEAQSETKKIQCWTDKNGQRMCGDRVPQEYAGQKRDVMKDGRVVDTITATKSADEKAAEERKKKEEEEALKKAEYDRALLESYRSPSDIIATRDERLALLDSRMQAAEKNSADTDKSLTGLRARADAAQQKGEPVDERLAKQIKQFEKSQKQNIKALDRYRSEREALQAKFARDYKRYSELRGLPVTELPPPAAKAPDAVETPKPAVAPTAAPAKEAPAAPKG